MTLKVRAAGDKMSTYVATPTLLYEQLGSFIWPLIWLRMTVIWYTLTSREILLCGLDGIIC